MEQDTPTVRYFALIPDGGTAENATGLVRRIETKPMPTDEAIGNDLDWHPTEYLHRYWLGHNDQDHVEVSVEFADHYLSAGEPSGSPPHLTRAREHSAVLLRGGEDVGEAMDRLLGVCGEHRGYPQSIHFFHDAGLDYVSCSPYRVPVARLEAARAALA